jgi:Fis family transcriptional regulator
MSNESATKSPSLAEATQQLIDHYLKTIDINKVNNLRQLILQQMEPPLLQAVIEKCKYNQSRAAQILGLSRGTCRSLLIKYFGEQYCGSRDTSTGG